MARAGVERRKARRDERAKRREFGEVARDAIRESVDDGSLAKEQAEAMIDATYRPRHLEQVRSAFVTHVAEQRGGSQALTASEFLGKIDFDNGPLFGLLKGFFPQLATAAKFAGLFREILEAFRELRGARAQSAK